MKILGLAHVALAPKNAKDLNLILSKLFSIQQPSERHPVDSEKVWVSMFKLPDQATLEVLEPLNNDSVIQGYLDKRGGGIHHLALKVDNVQEWIDHLKAQNVALLNDKPKPGAYGTSVVFLHPKSTGGILIELVQTKT